MLEKFSFMQFFKHRKSYIRVLQTRRETVPGCSTSVKESTRANCLGGGGWHQQITGRRKLNPSKTELIWLGSSRRLEHCPVGELSMAGVPIKPATYVRDLGVMTHERQRFVVASSHQPCYTNLLLPSASTASRPAFSHDRHGSLPGPSSCAYPSVFVQ